jgi:hypothetical protein
VKRRFDSYVRLARGIFGVSSVWLGPHDLLYVRGTGVLLPFTEDYVRFELHRIQSVAIMRTKTGMLLNAMYGGLSLVLGGLGGAALWQSAREGQSEVLSGMLSFLAVSLFLGAGLAFLLLVINVALGPTCLFVVQSATRQERLRAVRRVRTARRVLQQMHPVVLAVQSGGAGPVVSEARHEGTSAG